MIRVATISIDATVDGIKLGVQGATITLGVNEIPSIELMCAPSENGPDAPLKPKVYRPRIKDFSDLYDKLIKKTYGLNSKGDIEITVKYHDGDEDKIKLKEWILVGVGMSNLSSTNAPYLSVIMQHPICYLTKVGSIYETPRADESKDLNDWVTGSEDFIDVVNNTYEFYKNGLDYLPSPNDYPQKFRNMLGTGVFQINKYLTSALPRIFLAILEAESLTDRLAQEIARYVIPENDGSSTWDMLHQMCGMLMMSIVQDDEDNYTKERLVIEPTQPWKAPVYQFADEECLWTELPGVDPFRIIGVMAGKPGPDADPIDQGCIKSPEIKPEKDPTGSVMYTPIDSVEPQSDGRILMVPVHPILRGAMFRDAAYGSDDISATKTDGVQVIEKDYNGVLEKYCKAVYDVTAASMVQARMQMPLMFHTQYGFGKSLILPGNRCEFVSDRKTIYEGYINKVVHTMSIGGGCSTTLSMSHISPEGGFYIRDKIAIPDGTKNAAYEPD